MIIGDIKKINLSVSSFERMITNGNLYVDKTRLVEHFLDTANSIQLVARQRRLGKSLNMDMVRCFLTDRTDNRHLFSGLYVETSHVWECANSVPVFYFDFKNLKVNSYKEQIVRQIDKHISSYVDPGELTGYLKRCYDMLVTNPDAAADGMLFLSELVYEFTGKRSYILIDEYDKLLTDKYNTDRYDEIKDFETSFLSSGLKGNNYLEKALLTGVMRISHESLMSGLNNLVTYDVFNDNVYTDDYGVTDAEAAELSELCGFDIDEAREWYNGVKVNGHAIYNIYSLMSYVSRGTYECYWGKSGTMDIIAGLLDDDRKKSLARLLGGERVKVPVDDRISLKCLSGSANDDEFYSLLVQAGYLALDEKLPDGMAMVTIPNKELRIVWRNFILNSVYSNSAKIRTLFDNVNNLTAFSRDLEYFLSDRLSYYDLAVLAGEDEYRAKERIYHIFLLGILSAYDDVRCCRPSSNRESGDGRYDVFVERPDHNYIFEFKACGTKEELASKADEALAQIDKKRYGADIENGKRLIKVGIAFCGKLCKVKSGR
jgi:hypothetical protein